MLLRQQRIIWYDLCMPQASRPGTPTVDLKSFCLGGLSNSTALSCRGWEDHCLLQHKAQRAQSQDPVWPGRAATFCRAAWQHDSGSPTRVPGAILQGTNSPFELFLMSVFAVASLRLLLMDIARQGM